MWQLLGLAPTHDENAIRSAFKTRLLALKRNGQHEDARHVQPLRQAYEQALQYAAQRQQAPSHEAWGAAADVPSSHAAGDVAETEVGAEKLDGELASVDSSQFGTVTGEAVDEVSPGQTGGSMATEPPPLSADELANKAEVAALHLLGDEPAANLPRRFKRLRLQQRWQPLAAARALQQAIAWRLMLTRPYTYAYHPSAAQTGQDMRDTQRWLALLVEVAAHYRWWPAQAPGHANAQVAAQALWPYACDTSIDLMLRMMKRGHEAALCSTLAWWLQSPVMQALDSRTDWLRRCTGHLARCPEPPAAWLEALLIDFGLQDLTPGEHSEPEIDALIGLHHLQRRSTLLRRIASGREAHDHNSQEMAATLLQADITATDRQAVHTGRVVQGRPWLHQLREAIAWLQTNAPDVLDITEPKVLRWWRGPHVTPRYWWREASVVTTLLGAFVGTCASAVLEAAKADPCPACFTLGQLQLLVTLVAMAVCGWLGWKAAIGLTWLHMQWSTWLYPAWRRKDAALASRIPLVGPLLPMMNIWLSRDLLVLGTLLEAFGGADLKPYLIYGGWRLLLRLAARGEF